jgi:hypothetical protein
MNDLSDNTEGSIMGNIRKFIEEQKLDASESKISSHSSLHDYNFLKLD